MTALYAIQLIDNAIYIYTLILLIRVISSWFPEMQELRLMIFIRKITDPYLNIFRNIIPPLGGVLDISPILAFFVLQLLGSLVKSMFFR